MRGKSFKQKQQEVKQLTDTMNQSIESYFETSEQMAEYLSFMMQFYQYSLRNTALIQSQFRGAQAVGSYKFWWEKGFQVQKGEKASEQEKDLLKQGQLEKKESQLYFGKGSVFDVSQTDAKASDLPEIFPNKWLEGDVANYQNMLEAMKKIGGITAENAEIVIKAGADGVSFISAISHANSVIEATKALKREVLGL